MQALHEQQLQAECMLVLVPFSLSADGNWSLEGGSKQLGQELGRVIGRASNWGNRSRVQLQRCWPGRLLGGLKTTAHGSRMRQLDSLETAVWWQTLS